jgi:hypothetical protein
MQSLGEEHFRQRVCRVKALRWEWTLGRLPKKAGERGGCKEKKVTEERASGGRRGRLCLLWEKCGFEFEWIDCKYFILLTGQIF